MILIGQYDSPFVRRVGIALRLYGMVFEHRPLSVFADAQAVRALNPLMRVPVLVLDNGFVLTDSHMMLDYLDNLAAAPLFPRAEPARHQALKVAALGCGLADKAVSLFYERRLHDTTSPVWEARCKAQIDSVLAALEADRAARPGPFWFGDIGHADIAVACAWRFATEAHAGLIEAALYPALAAHARRCEALAVFQDIAQAFAAPVQGAS
jgi:glutathione S-transferase